MKKTISIIALFMFASMSGLSFADKDEGVKIKFSGQDSKTGVSQDKQTEKKTAGSGKPGAQSGKKDDDIELPKPHDH